MKMCSKALLAGLGIGLMSVSVYAETLTVTSWGGAYSMSQRKAYYEPFMKETGNVILEDEWGGELAAVRSQVETGNYKWDVIDVETGPAIQGCDEGIFEPLDQEKLGLDEDDFIDGGLIECGLGTITWATVLAFRTDVYSVEAGPKNWADFFDTSKFPGKRSLYKGPIVQHNLAIALVADGVDTNDVWKELRGNGVDRVFEKLDTIKDDVIWWETGAMAPQLLADKEVVMASGWNGRFYAAIVDDNQPFHLEWHGQVYDFGYFVLPMNSPKRELAYEFLRFAGRPDRQGDQTNYISYGNARKGTEQFANPDILPHLPTYPANLANAVKSDAQFWADEGEDIIQRWTTWLAK
jgi:putative spermidine/putrescine transport system substrate-binding protein